MKVLRFDYDYESREDATLRLLCMSDFHRGNPWMDENLFYKYRDWGAENDCMVLLGGDYGECINSKDVRHDPNAVDWDYSTPDKQYRKVMEDLEPLKGKIKVMLDGNHDYAFWKRHNHNYVNWMATDLNVPYPGISAYIMIRFRRKTGASKTTASHILRIFTHHGWTNARTDGYKVKVIHDLKNIFSDCHLYLSGHVHRLGSVFPTNHLYVDERTMSIREHTQQYYYTGSFIKGYEEGVGNYVESRAYPPTQLGSLILEVKPNRVDGRRDKSVNLFDIRQIPEGWMNGSRS